MTDKRMTPVVDSLTRVRQLKEKRVTRVAMIRCCLHATKKKKYRKITVPSFGRARGLTAKA